MMGGGARYGSNGGNPMMHSNGTGGGMPGMVVECPVWVKWEEEENYGGMMGVDSPVWVKWEEEEIMGGMMVVDRPGQMGGGNPMGGMMGRGQQNMEQTSLP